MEIKFHTKSSGRIPVQEFINEASIEVREQFIELVKIISSGTGLGMPFSRPMFNIHSGLHELRLKDGSGSYRIFYFVKTKEAIYFLHAFKKKTQKTPMKEIDIIIKRLKEIK